jgi:hypothetical protein
MNRHYFIALLLTFTLSACHSTGASAPRTASLNQEIQLAPAERASFGPQALEVEFVRVVEDSRCPTDATCVWAGEVKVELSIRSGAGAASTHEVIAGQFADISDYRVFVLQVQPQPISTRKISPEEYRVTLRVEPTSR